MKIRTKKWLSSVAFSLAVLIGTGSLLTDGNSAFAQEAKKPATSQQKKDSEKKESEKKESKKEDSKDKKKSSSEQKVESSTEAAKTRTTRRRRVPRYEKFQKFSPAVRELLTGQVKKAAQATVKVYCDDKKDPVALGTIINKKGYVVTKASRLVGMVKCKLSSGKTVPAIVCGIDQVTDLALLRLQAYNLPSVDLSQKSDVKEGHWLLSPSSGSDLVSYGVLSVAKRKIPHVPGFIGITMQTLVIEKEDKKVNIGVEVLSVVPRSAAEKYGLKTGDTIVMAEANKVDRREDLSKVLQTKRPGDVILLKVVRGKKDDKKDLSLRIVLGNRAEDTPQMQRSMMQNTMSGAISKRRDDFPMAIQHDTVLRPQDCGGPITDLDGNVIGVNIARGGRVKSYALPLSLVDRVYKKLVTGEYSPEVVYKSRIEGFSKILGTLETKASDLSKKIESLTVDQKKADKVVEGQKADVDLVESEMKELKEKMEALEKTLAEKKKVLSKGKLKRIQIGSGIKKNKRQLDSLNKQQEDIKKKLNGLLFGAER